MARRKNVKRIDPRYFLHETVNRNDDGSRLEEIFGFGKSKEEKAQAYFDRNWPKIEDMIGDDPGSQILDRVEKWLQEYPLDANDKGIQGAVESAIRYHKMDQERQGVEAHFADRASKKSQREKRYKEEDKAAAEAKAAKEREKARLDQGNELMRKSWGGENDYDAYHRTQRGPGAGSSTNTTRRRNRGELEEELEEGFFDAVGDLASRTGVFGKEDKKLEFWRRKGAEAAEAAIDSAMIRAKYLHPTAKKKILRQVMKDFVEGGYRAEVGIIRKRAAFAVKQADWAKGDKLDAKRKDELDRKAQDKEDERRRRGQKAADKRQSDINYEKYSKQMDREDKLADMRASYIPAAGSSTNTTRRRNRGELEENKKK